MTNSRKWRNSVLALIVLALSGCQLEGESYTANVERVIDGDTVRLVGGQTVRLIGVDTPETNTNPDECYGPEATQLAKQLLPEGKQVKVMLDPVNGTKPDRYDRTLAYVYAGDTFVNLELVKEGYAKADPYPNTTAHEDDFADAEAKAMQERRGMWGDPQTDEC